MRVVVAGSRDITDPAWVYLAISTSEFQITAIVSGGARGVDRNGERWAVDHSLPIRRFIPNWRLYGHEAGLIRNEYMAGYADALIAIWDGYSRGTLNMIRRAKEHSLRVFVLRVTTAEESD